MKISEIIAENHRLYEGIAIVSASGYDCIPKLKQNFNLVKDWAEKTLFNFILEKVMTAPDEPESYPSRFEGCDKFNVRVENFDKDTAKWVARSITEELYLRDFEEIIFYKRNWYGYKYYFGFVR